MSSELKRGLVIIPAYKAEKTLDELLGKIRQQCSLPVVVVDDGSPDRTSDIGRKTGNIVIRHAQNKGKGEALRTGFNYALESGANFIITMDADLQHPPDMIPCFLEAYRSNPDAIIIGSRKRDKNMPRHRRLSNSITSKLVSLRTGKLIRDVQCGLRLIPAKYIPHLLSGSKGFVFETEMIIHLADMKVPFVFLPIPTIYMKDGHSSIAHVQDTLNFITMYIRSLFRRDV